MSLGKKDMKALRRTLDLMDVAYANRSEVERLRSVLDRELKPKKFVRASRVRRQEKAKGRKAEMGALRVEVFARANGYCECCGVPFSGHDQGELDHFFGRARVKQALENCWALCRDCHWAKTNNRPGAGPWLERFIAHCFVRDSGALSHDRYRHAAEMAQARLDSLTTRGRAGEAKP